MRTLSIVLVMGAVVGLFIPAASAALLAYEGFDYAGTDIDTQSGGSGWSDAWSSTNSPMNLSDDDTSLDSWAFPFTPAGDRVSDGGGGEAVRNLSTGIDMGADGNVMYFSILMRRDASPAGYGSWTQLGLGDFKMGVGSDDKLYVQLAGVKGQDTGTTEDGGTYLLVGKLISGTSSQSALLKAYGPGNVTDTSEPSSWTATATVTDSTNVLSLIELSFGSQIVSASVDELRVGETWEDVVSSPVDQSAPIMYEPFDYVGTNINAQSGGSGWWNGAWVDAGLDLNLSDDDTSLNSDILLAPTVGDRVLDSGGGGATRIVDVPLDLAREDNVMYISVLMRKNNNVTDNSEWIGLEMSHTATSSRRFSMGIGSTDQFYIEVGNDGSSSSGAASEAETYLLVAKVVSKASNLENDEAFLKVYGSGDSIDLSEPTIWTASDTGKTGYVLGTLGLSLGANNVDGAIDEIRIGSTWGSVVAGSAVDGTVLIIQ